MSHPIRSAKIHVFKRIDAEDGGVRYMARLHPYRVYPVFFYGDTPEEAVAALEAVRAEAIEKHETAVINRQEAAEKARSAKARKAMQ
jgi:hypothetical protein